jgi:MFS family permease
VLSATAAILLLTAFAAGVTGAWSPCGFSVVETIGSRRAHLGGRAVATSCATFGLGALAGGAITFGGLASLGALAGGSSETGAGALVAVVAIALLTAFEELLGVRVFPQIRRQVPEPWRRTLPLPLATGLYGMLLGFGFTTYILTLAVWALAAIALMSGGPATGLLIGLGFGAGRALPVVLMAPRYATLGQRLEQQMAERPSLLRRLRLADGALLTALAAAFLASGSATAAQRPQLVATDGTDPSRAGSLLAYERVDHSAAVLVDGDAISQRPAENVAIGGRYLATRVGTTLTVQDRHSGATIAQLDAPRASQLAVSDRWLVWRADQPGGGDRLWAMPLPVAQAVPAAGVAHVVAGAQRRETIDRPALSGGHLAYAATTRGISAIVIANLATQHRRRVLATRGGQLSQPALDGKRLLYVQSSFCSQRLRVIRTRTLRRPHTILQIGSTAHRDHAHEPGYTTQGSEPSRCPHGTRPRTNTLLWTTALAGRTAYVTLLRPGTDGLAPSARIVRVGF